MAQNCRVIINDIIDNVLKVRSLHDGSNHLEWHGFVSCPDDLLFQEFAELISMDMGVELTDSSSYRELFHSLAELGSCNGKLSPFKSGRWFSWFTAALEHRQEFWSIRLLLQSKYPDVNPDRLRTSFEKLRSEGGGLKLALSCASWTTFLGVLVLMIGGKSMFQHYSESVQSIKSPLQGFKKTVEMVNNDHWMGCQQLIGLMSSFSQNHEFAQVVKYHSLAKRHFADVGHDSDSSDGHAEALKTFIHQMWYYVMSLLSKRSSTLSKLSAPPECYAALALDRDVEAQQKLHMDWKLLCLAEQNASAQDIANDLRSTVSGPVRLMYSCFEQGYLEVGHRILNGMLRSMPDTKFVEDLHQRVKTEASTANHQRLSVSQVQNILLNSGMFESRGVKHTAQIDEASFKMRWKRTKVKKGHEAAYFARHEMLPESYSLIFGKKTWASLSEDALARSAAAWEWLRFFSANNLKQKNIRLNVAAILLRPAQFVF